MEGKRMRDGPFYLHVQFQPTTGIDVASELCIPVGLNTPYRIYVMRRENSRAAGTIVYDVGLSVWIDGISFDNTVPVDVPIDITADEVCDGTFQVGCRLQREVKEVYDCYRDKQWPSSFNEIDFCDIAEAFIPKRIPTQ